MYNSYFLSLTTEIILQEDIAMSSALAKNLFSNSRSNCQKVHLPGYYRPSDALG